MNDNGICHLCKKVTNVLHKFANVQIEKVEKKGRKKVPNKKGSSGVDDRAGGLHCQQQVKGNSLNLGSPFSLYPSFLALISVFSSSIERAQVRRAR